MSNWIKCSERMPPFSQMVVAFASDSVCVGWLDCIDKDGDWWFQSAVVQPRMQAVRDDRAYYGLRGVTHWQPLPEPPND